MRRLSPASAWRNIQPSDRVSDAEMMVEAPPRPCTVIVACPVSAVACTVAAAVATPSMVADPPMAAPPSRRASDVTSRVPEAPTESVPCTSVVVPEPPTATLAEPAPSVSVPPSSPSSDPDTCAW